MSSNFQAEYNQVKGKNPQTVDAHEDPDRATRVSPSEAGPGMVSDSMTVDKNAQSQADHHPSYHHSNSNIGLEHHMQNQNMYTTALNNSPSQLITSNRINDSAKLLASMGTTERKKHKATKSLFEGKRRTVNGQRPDNSFDSLSLLSANGRHLSQEKLHFMINQRNTFEAYNQFQSPRAQKRSPNRDLTLHNRRSKDNLSMQMDVQQSQRQDDNNMTVSGLPKYQFGFNTRYDSAIKGKTLNVGGLPMLIGSGSGKTFDSSNPSITQTQPINQSMVNINSIQQLHGPPGSQPKSDLDEQLDRNSNLFNRRSRSTMRAVDHNLGVVFPRHSSIGPSELLKASGTGHHVPKSGYDYHVNLTKLCKHVKPGPNDYNLPSLFDNYNRSVFNISGLKKNPQHEFGIKHSVHRIMSKELLADNMGQDSPGVSKYRDVRDHTFEQIKLKFMEGIASRNGQVAPISPSQQQIGTFTTHTRFYENQTAKKIRSHIPNSYQGVNEKFGKLAQAKQAAELTEQTQRHYEASNDRTFFGRPAKCEGPGPAQNHNESGIVFHTISPLQKQIMKQVEEVRNSSLNDRFTITQKLGHKEYLKGMQAGQIAKNPGAADYHMNDFPYGKKNEFTMPKEERESNNLPAKNNQPSAQTYDLLTGHGNIDIKNLQVLEKLSRQALMKAPSSNQSKGGEDISQLHGFDDKSQNQMKAQTQKHTVKKFQFSNQIGHDREMISQTNITPIQNLDITPSQPDGPLPQKESPSKLRKEISRRQFDPSDLGTLITSPHADIYKTTYHVKGGSFPQKLRKNTVF